MFQRSNQDLLEADPLPPEGDPLRMEIRPEAIVEPAVWVPDAGADEPGLEYASWRDQLFAQYGTEGDG